VYIKVSYSGFRDTAFSLYRSKTVNKKDILRTVSNTGIYCSSDKVGTFSKIATSTSMHFVTRVGTWRVARLYSVQYNTVGSNSSISETIRNRTYIYFCLE
jgi:hypothetical protein